MSKKKRTYTQEFINESVSYALRDVSVTLAAKELVIPEATLHGWINHKPSIRELETINLDNKIASIFSTNKQRYGSPRITRELKKNGEICSFNRVANRMKALTLKAVSA